MDIKPTNAKDSAVIFQTFQKKYQLRIDQNTQKAIIWLSGGHVQYLQLSLIVFNEKGTAIKKDQLNDILLADERITLQSEELYESFNADEQNILKQIILKGKLNDEESQKTQYLFDTGCIMKTKKDIQIFSPLFETYLLGKIQAKTNGEKNNFDFTKKEYLLFQTLKETVNQICEREVIIAKVWPEYSEIGISDWAVDRLVARVRAKLKKQNSPFEIVTVKTRGYKLRPYNPGLT